MLAVLKFSLLMEKLRICIFHAFLMWWKIIELLEGFPSCPLLWAFHMNPIPQWEIRGATVRIYHIQSCSSCYSTYQRIKQLGLGAFFPIWNGCFVILILLLVLRRDYLIKYLSCYGGTLLEEQSAFLKAVVMLVLLLPFTKEVAQYGIQHLKVNFIRLWWSEHIWDIQILFKQFLSHFTQTPTGSFQRCCKPCCNLIF